MDTPRGVMETLTWYMEQIRSILTDFTRISWARRQQMEGIYFAEGKSTRATKVRRLRTI